MALIVEFICELPNGVHARPASHVETLCNTFSSQIEWHNLRTDRKGNAKSALALIGTDTLVGDNCQLLISGADEQEAYQRLSQWLRDEFPHCDAPLAEVKSDELEPLPVSLTNLNPQIIRARTVCSGSAGGILTPISSLDLNGDLLDTLRRVKCFGVPLVRIDIRQESTRHTEALGELTRYLGIGDYESWSEADKQAFLIRELNSKRPLLPRNWQPSAETREVLDTCQVIAEAPQGSIAAYVISMAKTPSDVLAVHLLLKEAGIGFAMPVAPLFETLDDLNNANDVMTQLLNIDWYRGLIQGKQMVMIGYSDSAKDAGVMAASWAQYQAQDALIKTCEKAGIELTLFHGRGGSIGRGGAPAHAALLSQPPGSLKGGLRVTEQGEMIRFKYGLPEITVSSLSLYTGAILEANLLPPPEPKESWRRIMDELSVISCDVYRGYVRENKDFVPYFRSATPEQELGKLPLGSRPAKRRPTGGVESLRAIPWIFAWTQNRLMLPAWLGAGTALQKVVEDGKQNELEAMCRDWPFFSTRLGMLEMVFAKADLWLAEYYDQRLVDKALWPLGKELRNLQEEDIKVVLAIANDSHLMADLPWIAESIQLRNIYTDPLNVLQAELLHRSRQAEKEGQEPDPRVEQALMVTIAGIAAGMRNTG
ncbi:phosphoenolpyruvate carboxylase [Escherichia coli]